jgi:hypothetical protein
VRRVRNWSSCDPLTLIDSEPWDALSLLLFLTECHLRVCVTHLVQYQRWVGGARDGAGV